MEVGRNEDTGERETERERERERGREIGIGYLHPEKNPVSLGFFSY